MKAIIVDDEKSMLLIMRKMLAKLQEVEIAGIFQDTGDAFRFLKDNPVDLIFVDIRMPEESGLEFARRIAADSIPGALVFLTSYKEYALEAYDVCAFDYIMKPIDQERLTRTVRRAMQRHELKEPDSSRPSGRLSVYGMGGLELRNGSGEPVQLNSSKCAELLSFLLLHHHHSISKWRIMEEVFRGMPPHNAEAYLNTTVYKLRRVLEAQGAAEVIITHNEGYSIDTKAFYVDFLDFEDRIKNLSVIDSSNLGEAMITESLYAGELFGDKGYCWSLPERERLALLYKRFGKTICGYLIKTGALTQSVYILKKLLAQNILDRDINCLMMHAYAAQRDIVSLAKQYELYTKTLQRELGITPDSMITEFYHMLQKSVYES